MFSKIWGCQADQCIRYSLKAKVLQMGSMEKNQEWSVSDDSLKRYVQHASESCIQELLVATSDAGGWKVVADSRQRQNQNQSQVQICRKWSGHVPVVRGRRIFTGTDSPSHFKALATAIETAKQWDENLVEGKHIKDIQDNLSIVKLRFSPNSKPLFRKREFIVYERRETMDDGTLVVAVASLPHEIARSLLPKSPGRLVRGILIQSGWVIEKLDHHPNSCMVTYVVQLDPAGWLPKWVVNKFSVKLAMSINCLSQPLESSFTQEEEERT